MEHLLGCRLDAFENFGTRQPLRIIIRIGILLLSELVS